MHCVTVFYVYKYLLIKQIKFEHDYMKTKWKRQMKEYVWAAFGYTDSVEGCQTSITKGSHISSLTPETKTSHVFFLGLHFLLKV